jgi:hypothetical protein
VAFLYSDVWPSYILVADIHILVNTVYSPSIVNSPASASWIPVCLPKFNPAGFVNAYITFLHRPDADQKYHHRTTRESNESADTTGTSHVAENSQAATLRHTPRLIEDSGIGLVCISGGGEFETVRVWCDIVTQVARLWSSSTFMSLTLIPEIE